MLECLIAYQFLIVYLMPKFDFICKCLILIKGEREKKTREKEVWLGLFIYLTGSQLLTDYLIPKFDSYLNVGF